MMAARKNIQDVNMLTKYIIKSRALVCPAFYMLAEDTGLEPAGRCRLT